MSELVKALRGAYEETDTVANCRKPRAEAEAKGEQE